MGSPLSPPGSTSHGGSISSKLSFSGMMNQGSNTPNMVLLKLSVSLQAKQLLTIFPQRDHATPSLSPGNNNSRYELQKLNNHVSVLESTAQSSFTNQQIVTLGLQAAEEHLKSAPKAEGKMLIVTSQIPIFSQAIIHPLLFELCRVKRSAKQDERIQMLVDNLEPLPNDLAFLSVGSNNKTVWIPCWTEKIDHSVNACFVNEIVDHVWENETALCNNPNGNSELPDAAYNKDVIIKMTKSYWRNLQMQVKACTDPAKFQKLCHARCSLIANHRRQAMAGFELKYDVQGAAAMIDMDFGSNYLSFNESSLSEDFIKCRKDLEAPTNGWMKVGLCWHSLDYIIFLIELDSIVKAHPTTTQHGTSAANAAPPAKRHKMTKKGDTSTKFYNKPPQSSEAQPTIPFKPMMHKAWLVANPSVKVLEGMSWLEGFHACAKKAYLEELAKWIAEHDGNDENFSSTKDDVSLLSSQ
ncbi:hypothetical protein BS17DRAFT_856990 [Gyrodon lividus]|nr:hypothetical protein BS17DRAFT_856990 [Gyrodon lividus]